MLGNSERNWRIRMYYNRELGIMRTIGVVIVIVSILSIAVNVFGIMGLY
jgi:hypothetical protein